MPTSRLLRFSAARYLTHRSSFEPHRPSVTPTIVAKKQERVLNIALRSPGVANCCPGLRGHFGPKVSLADRASRRGWSRGGVRTVLLDVAGATRKSTVLQRGEGGLG
jgi:hypothetical protein